MVHTLRQGRGYRFEHQMVQEFNEEGRQWRAQRLGGSSAKLPDILAVDISSVPRAILGLEAKTGTDTLLNVDKPQIDRCAEACGMFRLYESRYTVLAFKFSIKRRKRSRVKGRYTVWRELKEYYLLIDITAYEDDFGSLPDISSAFCHYDGKVTLIMTNNDDLPTPEELDEKYYSVFETIGGMLRHIDGKGLHGVN